MKYTATTTLKKEDTDGQIPAYTLDQYVRGELSQQLAERLKPHLPINRCDGNRATNHATVDFSTELVLLQPAQWQQLKALLGTLPSDHQLIVRQLLAQIDGVG